MDRKRLIGEVAARHGVRLEEDDPAFLLVTLSELMLTDAQDQFVAATRKAITEYQEAAQRVQETAGQSFAEAVRSSMQLISTQHIRQAFDDRLPRGMRPSGWLKESSTDRWQFVLAAVVLLALGFAVGRISMP